MKLYTGENCSKCLEAKGIIENKGLEVEIVEYNPSIREHRDLRIMGVPALSIEGEVLVGQQVIDYLNNLQ